LNVHAGDLLTLGDEMQVFISWSGSLSRNVALILSDWLPTVIQSVEPFFSDEDIAKGSPWGAELLARLDAANIGITCVTRDNTRAQWLNFESGAIAKAVGASKLMPFLINLPKADLDGPLTLFQVVSYTEDDVWKMVQTLNSQTATPVIDTRLRTTFDRFWPDLKEKIDSEVDADAMGDNSMDWKDLRSDREILEEVVGIVRDIRRDMRSKSGGRVTGIYSTTEHFVDQSLRAQLALELARLPTDEQLLIYRLQQLLRPQSQTVEPAGDDASSTRESSDDDADVSSN
jgi:hypothetical protein